MRLRPVLASAALGVLLLSGCAQEPGQPTKPAPSDEPKATTQASASDPGEKTQPDNPAGKRWSIPEDCARVVSSEQLARIDSRLEPMAYSATTTGEAGDEPRWEYSLGPAALAAMASATESMNCSWGIHSTDAGATVFVGRIGERTADELAAALADSVWEAYRVPGAAQAFSNPVNSEHRVSTHLIIDGDLLVIDDHTIAHPSGDFASFAFENLTG